MLAAALNPNPLMRHGVDGFSPSSWEPQEEGMMSTAVSFSLSKKSRFNHLYLYLYLYLYFSTTYKGTNLLGYN
jgi:hypothetical protein